MGMSINFNGASIRKPGVYTKTIVSVAGGFPLAPTGVVAIVGEALNGAPGSVAGVQTFTSQDLGALTALYGSGPIVDAARLLIAPARDSRVANGASQIMIYKTNAGSVASLALKNGAAASLFTITSDNYGDDQNLISVLVSAGVASASARIITIAKGAQVETLPENPRDVQLVITYSGAATANLLTIQAGVLTTTTASASIPADNLSITLAGKTVQQVVDLINANGAYTATSTLKSAAYKLASDLDPISTGASVLTALSLFAQQKELLDIINGQSALVQAVRVANVEGSLATYAPKKLLTGGSLGLSSNASFQAGFDALLAKRANIVVPLISQDASALAVLGLTDPASTFTVDSVNVQVVTHCITASNTKNRSERNCYPSVKRSFASSQTAAQTINSARASMLFQDVQVLGSDGNLAFKDPWAAACMVAGIQAGTDVGTPPTFKFVNANSLKHVDYNYKTQVDLAIDAGLLPLEIVDSGGIRIVVGNTTYGIDANFVYNRISVQAAADEVAYNLRKQLEAIFIGEKVRTGSALSIRNSIIAIMSTFLLSELIVGDDTNKGLGWKDLTVTLVGNAAYVAITITPVQGIDFILPTITLDNIRQSA